MINRRKYLQTVAAIGAAGAVPLPAAANPIQLHVDLDVDPAKEQEMVKNFRQTFQPTIRKQPGFVDVNLLKKREGFGYRLLISFQTEEQRKTWVATNDHQRVWPAIEKCLKGEKYKAALYDVV